VQALSSLHGRVLLLLKQPVAGVHPSSVQTLLSLQLGAGPPTQVPPLHASFVVHALPSLHGVLLLTVTQPMDGLQLSSVQPLASSQTVGPPGWQLPPEHTSPSVHAFASLQTSLLGAFTHDPNGATQLSSVQPF
jgi:hypothetical protein